MNDIVLALKSPFRKLKDKSHPFWFFVFLFALGILMSLYFLLTNEWTIPLSGDFTQQEIPFYINGYDDWWHFFKTGEFPLWDNNTVLGANNIASNSFYYFLNPFFLPILFVPRSLIPQAQAMFMLIKMALAGMAMRSYLKYMGVKEKNARMFALAYAFCGYNLYFMWFNHFLEIAVTFPLIMLGIEKVLKEKKPWLLIGSVFVMGLCNYTFLVSSCIAGVMYAGFRFFQDVKKKSTKDNLEIIGLGVMGFALGIMLCAFVLLPCFMDAANNPRVEDAGYLDNLKSAFKLKNWKEMFDLLFKFDYEKKTYYPLITFLFPVISDFNASLFNNTGYDNTLSSIFVYTPLLVLFVPSLINSIKKRKISHLIAVAAFILLLFTPFFYWLSFAFAKEYGRWQIFVTFALVAYIAISYEDKKKWPKWYLDVSLLTVLALMGLTVYLCLSKQSKYIATGEISELGDRVYVVVYQAIYLFIVYAIIRFKFDKARLNRYVMGLMSIEIIVMGNLVFNIHGTINYSSLFGGKANSKDEASIIRNIKSDDDDFFRIFNTTANRSTNNLGMVHDYNGLGGFHSAYNYELEDFLLWSRIPYYNMTWTMGEHEKLVNVEQFLGVKYYIIRNSDYNIYQDGEYTFNINHVNVPYGFELVEEYSTNLHSVYVNSNYMPLGYAYDNLIYADRYSVTLSSGDSSNIVKNEEAYLEGAIVYPQDIYEDYDQEYYEENISSYTASQEYFATLNKKEEFANFDISYKNAYGATQAVASGRKYDCSTSFDPLNPTDVSVCSVNSTSGYTYGRTIFNYVPTGSNTYLFANNASEENPAYVRINLPQNAYAFIYLYGDNDELLTFDYHQYIDSSFKNERGFYVDQPVKRMVIRPMTTSTSYQRNIPINLFTYTQYYDQYENYLNPLKASAFKNVVSTTNTHTFDTSYTKEKYIVLNVPYDSGWSVKITNNEQVTRPTVYKAQGGFVGFIAPSGDSHIEVTYMTPYLKIGTVISFVGFVVTAGAFGLHYYLKKRKKKTINPFLEMDDGSFEPYDEDYF